MVQLRLDSDPVPKGEVSILKQEIGCSALMFGLAATALHFLYGVTRSKRDLGVLDIP